MNEEKTKYVEVLFVTLSTGNNRPHQRLWKDVAGFCTHLSRFTKCHLYALRGYEKGKNSHEHLILLVPSDELDRFNDRFPSFQSWKAWSWIHEVSPFKPELKESAYTYTLVKHEPVLDGDSDTFFCPKYYTRCRRGACSHKATINWQQQLDLF